MKKTEIDGLTGLRGFAALWIMFFYARRVLVPIYAPNLKVFLSSGFTGVDTFFVLSGFLLFLPFAEKLLNKQKRISLNAYFKRRLLRIFPAYYTQITILLILGTFGLYERGGVENWLFHISMTHNFSSMWAGSINGAWWTLPIEFEFYLALPLIYLLIKRFGVGIFTLSFIILAIGYKIALFHFIAERDIGYKSWAMGQLPGCMDLFGCGILGAIIYQKYPLFLSDKNKLMTEIILLVLGITGMSLMLHWVRMLGRDNFWNGEDNLLFMRAAIHGVAVLFLVLGIAVNGVIGRIIFANKIILFMGEISYGIYLWHMPVLIILLKNAPHHTITLWGNIVIYIITTLGMASASYYFIERRCMRMARC